MLTRCLQPQQNQNIIRNKACLYLPFGLKDSPWVFPRVVATPVAHLRLQGIQIFYYIDDWLLVAESQTLLLSHLQTTLQLSQSLVFITNREKSMLVPQRLPTGVPRSFLKYSQVNCPSGRAQSGCSSVALPGAHRVSGSSCSPVAEVPRTSGQFCVSSPELQGSHAASSVTLPSVILSSTGPSVQTDSFTSGYQEPLRSLVISEPSSGREPLSPLLIL